MICQLTLSYAYLTLSYTILHYLTLLDDFGDFYVLPKQGATVPTIETESP